MPAFRPGSASLSLPCRLAGTTAAFLAFLPSEISAKLAPLPVTAGSVALGDDALELLLPPDDDAEAADDELTGAVACLTVMVVWARAADVKTRAAIRIFMPRW